MKRTLRRRRKCWEGIERASEGMGKNKGVVSFGYVSSLLVLAKLYKRQNISAYIYVYIYIYINIYIHIYIYNEKLRS